MKHTVKMRNPKTGKVEIYNTKADSLDDLQPALDLWVEGAGYEILSVEQEKR